MKYSDLEHGTLLVHEDGVDAWLIFIGHDNVKRFVYLGGAKGDACELRDLESGVKQPIVINLKQVLKNIKDG